MIETALRALMEALTRSGRPASALAAYSGARERLAEDLGVGPSTETEALHTAILLDELPAARVPDGSPVTTSVELPGRAGALSELDALFQRVERGRGQVGVVEGDAGIGKSRLLGVWSDRLAARGVRVVPVAGDELGRALPLQTAPRRSG